MKTLLCVIAALAFLALPVLAEDVKVTFDGSRLAAGYIDNGKLGNVTPGTFAVADAKLRINATFDADTSAVLRLNFADANLIPVEDYNEDTFDESLNVSSVFDYAYVKLANVVKKLAKSDTVNPDIYVGLMKINFGEETWGNNPVENALVQNSIGGIAGEDIGIEFRQNALPIELPVVLGYSLSIFNGGSTPNDPVTGQVAGDDNNTKAYCLKVMGQMKSIPLYFSLSQYDSGKLSAGSVSAMGNMPTDIAGEGKEYIQLYELNVRYDILEGAQKFDPSKAPLFSDAKGVFRLAYGKGADIPNNLVRDTTTMMLDGIYNVNKEWYVAFRYSSTDDTFDKYTRISIGGGHKLSDKAILKLDYTTNGEPSDEKIDDDQIALLMTVLW